MITNPVVEVIMTKSHLINELAGQLNIDKTEAKVIINTIFDSITEALSAGDKVELRGFGSFRVKRRKARNGQNPKTGEKVKVPPKTVPFFKPGKELKSVEVD